MSTTLVYVHGTNGSGKSTLARAIITAAGGVDKYQRSEGTKAGSSFTPSGVSLLGKYTNSCGGVDGIQPYADAMEELRLHSIFPEARVFAEGLVTPGVQTCTTMASWFDRAVFILLDTPEAQCITNVLARRTRAGNTKPYSPDNLYVKARSARSWLANLRRAGLEAYALQYPQAYRMCTELLQLEQPSVAALLT